MRKLNGITINGEYLGNSVVINGMFRAICTISPVIMRDFVTIINKIEQLDDAVKIRNFNCGFDCIDIEFENAVSKGIASLYFKLHNGEPELTNCKLVIDNQEYSTFQDKISLAQKNTSQMTNPSKPQTGEETERQKRIRELKERKLEQQKKLVEMKKQKLEELKRQKLDDLKNKTLEQSQKSTGLSPEELKEKKRKELLEKKKYELLNKKREEAGLPPLPPPAINSDDEAVENANIKGETAEKSDDSSVDVNNIQKTQSSTGIEDSESDNIQSGSADSAANDSSKKPDCDGIENLSVDETDTNVNSENDANTSNAASPEAVSSINGFDDEYDNLTDEELAALEAELDSEMQSMSEDDFDFDSEQALLDAELKKYSDMGSSPEVGSYTELAETISKGLMQGLSQGLSDGLCQGLSQFSQGLSDGLSQGFSDGLCQGLSQLSQGLSDGLCQGLSQGLSAMFNSNQNPGYDQFNNYDQTNDYDFNTPPKAEAPSNTEYYAPEPDNYSQQYTPPNFNQIDDYNNYAAMNARNSYSYDENSNMDDLSDLYSDFYSETAEQRRQREQQDEIAERVAATEKLMRQDGQNTSEIEILKAELEALKAETAPKKELMTLDEFLEKQKLLAEAKEKKRRQKFRIVGSRERVNASALDNGVFVAGNKVYKWGDTKILDE